MAADFYLASSEGYGLNTPRRCQTIKRLASEHRNDLLLISIDPPVIGQPYGLGDEDIGEVVIATRHQGASLFPIVEWPVFVHVARLLVPFEGQDRVRTDDFEVIAWAELYETEEAARSKKM